MAVYGETEHIGFRRDVVEIARRIMWARDDGLGVNCGVRLVAFCNDVTCEMVSDDNGQTFQLDGTGNGDEQFLDEVRKHVVWMNQDPHANGDEFAKLIDYNPAGGAFGSFGTGLTEEQKRQYRQDAENNACTRLQLELCYSGFLSSFVNPDDKTRPAYPNRGNCLKLPKTSEKFLKSKPTLRKPGGDDDFSAFRCTEVTGIRCFFEPKDELDSASFTDGMRPIVNQMAMGQYERKLKLHSVFILEVPPPAKVMYYGEMLLFDAPFVGVLSERPSEFPVGGLRCSGLGQRSPFLVPEPVVEPIVELTDKTVIITSLQFATAYANDLFGPLGGYESQAPFARVLLDFGNEFYAGDIITEVAIGSTTFRIENWTELAFIAKYCWVAWANGGIPYKYDDDQELEKFGFIVGGVLGIAKWSTKEEFGGKVFPPGLNYENFDEFNEALKDFYTTTIGPRLPNHRMTEALDDILNLIIRGNPVPGKLNTIVENLNGSFKETWGLPPPDKNPLEWAQSKEISPLGQRVVEFTGRKDVEFTVTVQKRSRQIPEVKRQCLRRDGFPHSVAAECCIKPLADVPVRIRTSSYDGLLRIARWNLCAYADQATGGGRDFVRSIPPPMNPSMYVDDFPVNMQLLWGGVPGTFWTRCLSQPQPWTHVSDADVDGLSDIFGDGLGIMSLYSSTATEMDNDELDECYELVSLHETRFLREPSLSAPVAAVSFDGAGSKSWSLELNATTASNAISFAFFLLREFGFQHG